MSQSVQIQPGAIASVSIKEVKQQPLKKTEEVEASWKTKVYPLFSLNSISK